MLCNVTSIWPNGCLQNLTGLTKIALEQEIVSSEHQNQSCTTQSWTCPTDVEPLTSGIIFKDAIARQSQQVSIIHLTSRANVNKALLAAVSAILFHQYMYSPTRGQHSIAA